MLLPTDPGGGMIGLGRVCAKIYSPEPAISDERFVPIFHRWIRRRALGGLLLDVADYTHVPEGPGVVLVGHDTSFSLDRSDGRFGLLVQRRRPFVGDPVDGLASTLEALFSAADALERDADDAELRLDRTRIRIESNDRLRSPNTDEGFLTLRPIVARAAKRLFANHELVVERAPNDPGGRLAVDVLVRAESSVIKC